MTCLSKGLGAPVGSVIAGRADDMDPARLERKRLGGSMRQVGVFAAPGLIAVRDHVERLADDHARARRLAEAVAERWPGPSTRTGATNIVVAPPAHAPEGRRPPGRGGVLATMLVPTQLRSSPTSTSTTPASPRLSGVATAP